ncbi:MAG: hypothetical protein QHH24_06040 [Candidatus Bathyarchaeota archaeon]|nr:hypothetical protein [Candidatus Bathyarchaeota archaeon]
MILKWIGLALLLLSLIIGSIMAADVQLLQRKDTFAVTAENKHVQINGTTVPVPPLNRTEEEARQLGKNWGWVGFNITLPNQGKQNYEAYGVILPANPSPPWPDVVMAIVNATPPTKVGNETIVGGFDLLTFDQFSDEAWAATKVYAAESLTASRPHATFSIMGVDNASKYTVFFRGRANGTDDSLIVISIKETWLENTPLIPASTTNATIIAAIAVLGMVLTSLGFRKTRRRLAAKRFSLSQKHKLRSVPRKR